MEDGPIAALYAAAGAMLASVVGWLRARLAKSSAAPTVIEVLQARNADLLRMHTENLDRIKKLEHELRDVRVQLNAMGQELINAKERIGLLTGQLTARTAKEHD